MRKVTKLDENHFIKFEHLNTHTSAHLYNYANPNTSIVGYVFVGGKRITIKEIKRSFNEKYFNKK